MALLHEQHRSLGIELDGDCRAIMTGQSTAAIASSEKKMSKARLATESQSVIGRSKMSSIGTAPI
jgi:hypothetical protein